MTRAILSAVAACLLFAACATGQPHLFKPQPGTVTPAGGGFSATLLRSASGAPSGVRLSWEQVAGPFKYNLYRSDAPIPDSEVGNPALRVNAAPIEPGPSSTVVYDDLFPTNVGDSWYYRVSSLDDTGDESEFSPESSLTITDFIVTQLVTTEAGVGDPVEIIGVNFGSYDAATDKVFFPGVRFVPGTGFQPELIEAVILEHEINRIRCTVPDGATTGKVRVQNNGLSQDTPEDFLNTDPFIESILPLQGNTDDTVTVTGRNFGSTQDANHRLILEGTALPAGQYVNYADGQIQFRPLVTSAASFAAPLWVNVRVSAKSSNTAQFVLDSRPPMPAVSADPLDGQTPQVVEFDASDSTDPDTGDELAYAWDFDADGVSDLDTGSDPTASHTFASSGVKTVRVWVRDLDNNVSDASVDVTVNLSDFELIDNGNFAPGSEFFQDGLPVQINFILQGGEPEYGIKWFLEDPANGLSYMLANDTGLPTGEQSRAFTIDTAMARPADGVDRIPAGFWRIRAEANDGGSANDPDPIVSWPSYADGRPGVFAVYRYNAILVQDEEGDASGTETSFLNSTLFKLGYKTAIRSSKNLTLGDLSAAGCVVWGLDGAYGTPGDAFSALGALDTGVMRQYLDGGGNLVLFCPPGQFGGVGFADRQFELNYQPFAFFRQQSASPWDHDLRNFAADGDHTLISFTTTGLFGEDAQSDLRPGSTALGDFVNPGNGFTYHTLASRESSGGGTCVFGMFVFSKISGVAPQGSTPDWLLDNLVAGSIKN